MTTFIVVLNTQLQNIKLRSSKLIIKCDAQKQMIDFGLDADFMTLNNLNLDYFFIICTRASSQIFVENHQLNVIVAYPKHNLGIYLYNIIYLHTSCNVFQNMQTFPETIFVIINFLALQINMFKLSMIFQSQNSKLVQFHLHYTRIKSYPLVPCLHPSGLRD